MGQPTPGARTRERRGKSGRGLSETPVDIYKSLIINSLTKTHRNEPEIWCAAGLVFPRFGRAVAFHPRCPAEDVGKDQRAFGPLGEDGSEPREPGEGVTKAYDCQGLGGTPEKKCRRDLAQLIRQIKIQRSDYNRGYGRTPENRCAQRCHSSIQ
jgi:hypothetical protein